MSGTGHERAPPYPLPDTSTVGPEGQLMIGGCDTLELAAEFGTPLFVYDEAHLRPLPRGGRRLRPGVNYATKAFLCRAMAAWRSRRA
jgi:diaminopimelate decarboxylase